MNRINNKIIPATPKVLNMDNPVQAKHSAGYTILLPTELRSSSTPTELCVAVSLSPRAAATALHGVIHIQLLRSCHSPSHNHPKITVQTTCDTMKQPYFALSQGCDTMKQPDFALSQGCDTMNLPCFALSQGCETMNPSYFALSQGCDTMKQPYFALSQGCDTINLTCFTLSEHFKSLNYTFTKEDADNKKK
jgi:hypothetical protein